MSKEPRRMSDEYMKGRLDGIAIARDVAESLLAQANSEKAALMRCINELGIKNEKLHKLVHFIMHQCNDGNPRCDDCISRNDGECVVLLRMHELGVIAD